ncbi:kinase-like domain-containing protein, partial [Glomus cerebriforme]
MPYCQECHNFLSKYNLYCKPCNSVYFQNNFAHWTSGDSNIDKLIQNSQLNAKYKFQLIEWIECSNFKNVEFVAHGGFGSVYKAIWKDGPIVNKQQWDINKSKWKRENEKEVAIKKFRNMTSASSEFMNEVKNNLELGAGFCNKIYGVTRDTQNGEYAIVIEFQNDFHSGNILNKLFNGSIRSVISDFGLSCPVNQNSKVKTLYGVLPFVAPEVLRGGEFTKAADIYGFGMLMSEIINGEVPFIDRDYDLHLAFDICEGKRPLIPEYTPEPYVDLMKRCWDPDPTYRPTAGELKE